MKAVNFDNREHWGHEEGAMKNVIYLYDYTKARTRRKRNNSDIFWNVVFTGLCLSVLVILFLH